MRSLDSYAITLKHLLIALSLVAAGYIAAQAWADHVAIRAIVVQIEDVQRTVSELVVR